MNIALLTAAGIGSRMRLDIPKQFLHINNKPVILYTLEAFQRHPQIDAVLVVTLDAWKEVLNAYARQYHISKLKWVVTGGRTGQESIWCGLQELSKRCDPRDVIMIHDGNRPLISDEIISDSLATYYEYGDAVAAMPCVEAIFKSEDAKRSVTAIPREQLFRTQTPHTYPLCKLLWAHQRASELSIENTAATCVLMQQLGEVIHFSKGSEKNIKLTTTEDIEIFEALLRMGTGGQINDVS